MALEIRSPMMASVLGALVCACSSPKAPAITAPTPSPPVVSVAPAEPAASPASRLPPVEADARPVKSGDDYTVWGLGFSRRPATELATLPGVKRTPQP